MRELPYFLAVSVALVFVAFGMAKISEARDPAPASPAPALRVQWASPRKACREVAEGFYWCPDGRAWQDAGPLTPIPPRPQG